MNDLEPQFRRICDALLRAWEGPREVDLKQHLATEFPVRVLGYLLDIPQSDYGVIRSLAAGTESGDFISGTVCRIARRVHPRAYRAPPAPEWR